MPSGVENGLRTLMKGGTTTTLWQQEIEQILADSGGLAVDAFPEAAAGGAVAVIQVCSDFLIGTGFLPFLLIAAVFVLTFRLLEYVLANLVAPIPMVGHRLRDWVHLEFRWLDNVENYIIRGFEGVIIHLLKSLGSFILWVTGIDGPPGAKKPPIPVQPKTGYVTQQQYRYQQWEIHQLQGEYNYLQNTLDPSVQAPTQPSTNTTIIKTGVPQQVWNEIYALQQQVHSLQNTNTAQDQRLSRLEHEFPVLKGELDQLVNSLHGLRSVSVGWQDVQQQVYQLQQTIIGLENDIYPQLDSATNTITQMAPLTLLLEPGIKGLRNLRKLEDNMCQCPRFFQVPNELGTALALLEFVENG